YQSDGGPRYDREHRTTQEYTIPYDAFRTSRTRRISAALAGAKRRGRRFRVVSSCGATHGRSPRGASHRHPRRTTLQGIARAEAVKPIEFHPDAADEVRDTVAYYERLRAGLGDDFQDELKARLASIQSNPQLYGIESGAIRVCPLHRFPFSIYYEELAD